MKNFYTLALSIVFGLWIWANGSLMIAPVWDEVNFLLAKDKFPHFDQLLHYIWFTTKLYRPLATSCFASIMWLLPFDLAWPLLRMLNALMVITSFWLIADAAKRLYATHSSPAACVNQSSIELTAFAVFSYWLAFFLSPAALIVSTWFANIFDASCLLCIALGLAAWTRARWFLAGSLLGIAWFCKEAAVFAVPLLGYLYLIYPATRKGTVWSSCIYLGLGIIYWLLRSQVVALGSVEDIHAFAYTQLFSTWQGIMMRFSAPSISVLPASAGFIITLVLTLSAWHRMFFAFAMALILCATLAYLGTIPANMISTNSPLIGAGVFDARFFHIPIALFMFALLLQGRAWPFLLMAFAFSTSFPFEYQHYRQFQTTYASYYNLAAQKPSGIIIFASKASGVQQAPGAFGLTIGEYPQADYVMNPQNGDLTPTK